MSEAIFRKISTGIVIKTQNDLTSLTTHQASSNKIFHQSNNYQNPGYLIFFHFSVQSSQNHLLFFSKSSFYLYFF